MASKTKGRYQPFGGRLHSKLNVNFRLHFQNLADIPIQHFAQ